MFKIVYPFVDIKIPRINEIENKSNFLDTRVLNIGFGSKVFRADQQGIWLGAEKFGDAPFSVDMDGNIVGTTLALTMSQISDAGALATLDQVNTLQIVDDAISNAKIAINAIQGDIIAAGAITENKLYTGAVTADKIDANAITSAKILAGAITAAKVGANEIIANTANIKDGIISSAKIGSLDANKINVGTLTGFTIQTSIFANTGVKLSSALGGIIVYGLKFELRDTTGILYGYIGGDGGYYKIQSHNNRNILIDANLGTVHFGSEAAPLTDGGQNLGYYNFRWGNCYALNFTFQTGIYFNYTGGYIQSNGQFRVVGSINLTGNMTFENYSSIIIKDSGGISRTLTVKWNATLSKYILST